MEGDLDLPAGTLDLDVVKLCDGRIAVKELVDRGENLRRIGRLGEADGGIVADRFEVRDDPHHPRHAAPHVILEQRGLAMGLFQRERLGHLQVQFQPTLRVLLVKADGMRPEAPPGGKDADLRGDVVVAQGQRLGVDHHVGVGHDGADGLGRLVGDFVGPLEADRMAHRERDVGKHLRSGPPHADLRDRLDAVHLPGRTGHLVAKIVGDAVQEVVDRLLAQLQADPDHDSGHGQGGDRVGAGQPRQIEVLRRQHAQQSEEHDARRPDVGREVQGIGLQGLAVVFLRYPQQGPRARKVDDDREHDHQKRPRAGIDFNRPVENSRREAS